MKRKSIIPKVNDEVVDSFKLDPKSGFKTVIGIRLKSIWLKRQIRKIDKRC